jgi:tetratricopeptide (TPR) repeat protein
VHVGRCLEEDGAHPYQPWIQLLRDIFGGREPAALEPRLDANAAAALAQLVLGQDASSAAGPEATRRFTLFEAVSRVLHAAAAVQPRLLVIDDLHRADPSSLLLLRHVAEGLAAARLMLLGTHRSDELASRVSELHPAGTRVALEGLSASEVAELVHVTAGEPPSAELAAEIHARTGGNPLFVEEVARALAAEGSLGRADAVDRARSCAPEGVRQMLQQRVTRLPEATRAVLEVAAVVGREFDLDVLERASGVARGPFREALGLALDAGFVAAEPRAVARLRFRHILVRDALYESLSAARRASLHAAVGDALERGDRFERDSHADALAHHFEQALLAGEAPRAARWTRRAAERAFERAAWEDAAELCVRALRAAARAAAADETALADAAATRAHAELLLLLGRARWFGGETASAREAFRAGADIAREIGAADLFARAALGFTGRTDATPGVNRTAVALLEAALAGLPEPETALRSEVMARLGTELYYDVDPRRSEELTRSAVTLAESTGNDALLAYALSARHYALLRPEVQPAARLAMIERVIDLAERSGALDVLALGVQQRVCDLLELGEGLRLENSLHAYERVVATLRQPFFRWFLSMLSGMQALIAGEVEGADRLARETLALGQSFDSPNAFGAYSAQLFAVRREQGRVAELEALLRGMVREQPDLHVFRTALAAISGESGRREEARDAVKQLVESDLERFPRDQNWIVSLTLAVPAAAISGEPELGRRLARLLAPYAGRVVVAGHGAACDGAVDHHLGVLASALGDADLADEHFTAARALHRKLRAPLWLAHTQREQARALWKRGSPGDREQARVLQAEAIAAYERFGLAHRVSQARDLSSTSA